MKFKFFAASVMLMACAIPASAQVKLQADNVDAVLKAMTLEEKATLCIGYSRAQSTETGDMIGQHADLVPA